MDRSQNVETLKNLILSPIERQKHQPNQPYTKVLHIPNPHDPNANPEELSPRTLEAAYAGPDFLTEQEIQQLLNDTETLSRFSLLVHDLMPDWWLDELEKEGRKLAKRLKAEKLLNAIFEEEQEVKITLTLKAKPSTLKDFVQGLGPDALDIFTNEIENIQIDNESVWTR
jgi:hypothetical protein